LVEPQLRHRTRYPVNRPPLQRLLVEREVGQWPLLAADIEGGRRVFGLGLGQCGAALRGGKAGLLQLLAGIGGGSAREKIFAGGEVPVKRAGEADRVEIADRRLHREDGGHSGAQQRFGEARRPRGSDAAVAGIEQYQRKWPPAWRIGSSDVAAVVGTAWPS